MTPLVASPWHCSFLYVAIHTNGLQVFEKLILLPPHHLSNGTYITSHYAGLFTSLGPRLAV